MYRHSEDAERLKLTKGKSTKAFEASIFPKNIHFFATLLEHVGKELQPPGPKNHQKLKR